LSPDEKTFVSASSLSMAPLYVCDSKTGHYISSLLEFEESENHILRETKGLDVCFSPDGRQILVRYQRTPSYFAVVWEIERGEKVSQIEGFDFVFIHCGQNKGRIASVDWIDKDGSSIQRITSEDHPTHILRVKLWDIGNDISDRLFEVTDVAVT